MLSVGFSVAGAVCVLAGITILTGSGPDYGWPRYVTGLTLMGAGVALCVGAFVLAMR